MDVETYYDFEDVPIGLSYTELVNALLEVKGLEENQEVVSDDLPLVDSGLDESTIDQTISDVQLVQSLDEFLNANSVGSTSPLAVSAVAADTPIIGTDSPETILFNGAVWISGRDSMLGDIVLYAPADSRTNWGLDSNGYLVYLGNSSVTCYLQGVYNNSATASVFSAPRYRLSNSSNYQYLSLKPDNSNAPIAVQDSPRLSVFDALPFLAVGLLGVMVLFLSKLRS